MIEPLDELKLTNKEKEPLKEVPDLFPYKIKDVNNFYNRDHPVNINPQSNTFQKYWMEQLTHIVEGKWVDDNGTWVYMPPKLYFYINYAKIIDEERKIISPILRDVEWIIFSYHLCCNKFSGFELDEEYTCYHLVGLLEEGKVELDEKQIEKIPDSAKKPNGSYKKYINPWVYLTQHYLIDNKASKPLGLPLYENPYYNFFLFSSRSLGKSLSVFVGDVLHEHLTSGIRYMSDLEHINKRLNFGMGCGDTRQLNRSLNNIKAFYDKMPGQYRPPEGKKYMGPFYKRMQGSWSVGSEIEHRVKGEGNTDAVIGNHIQMMALTPDRITVGAGDRFRRIVIEEVGFANNLIDIHNANKDSLKVWGKRIGMAVYIGTGGSIERIRQPKYIFEHPEAYDFFSIPNYWENPKKKIGLFLPVYYASMDYKDRNGNTDVKSAYQAVLKDRVKLKAENDSFSYESEIMFNPLKPSEMLRPSNAGHLPKQEAQIQLDRLESHDLFRNKAQIGRLNFNPIAPRGVEWRKDLTKTLKPILLWGDDDKKTDKKGAIIVYEHPPEHIPERLYYIIFDPVSKPGDGTSFNSVLVYKHIYVSRKEDTLFDTIVAEWMGRNERQEDNYNMVIKLARYYNAKIFPETNTPGFVDWARKSKYGELLEGDVHFLEKKISPNARRSVYGVGYELKNKLFKNWALTELRDWLTREKKPDPVTGMSMVRTMDWIFSPRILTEIIAFTDDPDENFDHISSLLGLMFLIRKLEEAPPVNLDLEEVDELKQKLGYVDQQQRRSVINKRASFLQY